MLTIKTKQLESDFEQITKNLIIYYVSFLLPPKQVSYHKLCGLKQHKFVTLQFQRTAIQNEYNEVKIKVLAGLVSSLGKKPCPCLPQLLEAAYNPLAAISSIFKYSYIKLLFCSYDTLSCIKFSASIMIYVITFRTHPDDLE